VEFGSPKDGFSNSVLEGFVDGAGRGMPSCLGFLAEIKPASEPQCSAPSDDQQDGQQGTTGPNPRLIQVLEERLRVLKRVESVSELCVRKGQHERLTRGRCSQIVGRHRG